MLATTAGGFIYIATVGILPAVINEKSSLHEIFLECVGFSVGIGFMVVVAYLEVIDEINVWEKRGLVNDDIRTIDTDWC